MLQVEVHVDGRAAGTVTDGVPNVSFALTSDVDGEELDMAMVGCAGCQAQTQDQLSNPIATNLEPWTSYEVRVHARGTSQCH